MPERWTTLAVAAATLNVHPRTIERRIASGKVQSRRTDDGQLQVLVDVPDQPAVAEPSPLETVKEMAEDQITLATGSASAIVRLAQADADRARGELELVRQDAGRVRRGARVAWIAVAGMSLAVCIAVGWTTHRLTRSDEQIATLTTLAERMEERARALEAERDSARREAQSALLAGAESEGRLAAYVEHAKLAASVSDNRPTTRPASLAERIVWALSNQ